MGGIVIFLVGGVGGVSCEGLNVGRGVHREHFFRFLRRFVRRVYD